MTWTKLGDDFTESPVMRGLTRDARYLRVEALVWCNRHRTDGEMRFADLHWITDSPDPKAAVDELLAAGLWATTPDGWQVVDWDREQPLAEDVARVEALRATRQRRWRQHKNGDHSLCDPEHCHMAATHNATHNVTPSRPARADPTEREGKARRGGVSRSLAEGSLRLAALEVEAALAPGGEARIRFPAPGEWWMTAFPADDPPEPTDLTILISHPRDEHVKITVTSEVDYDGDQPVETAATRATAQLLHLLATRLQRDIDKVHDAHGCPRRANSTEDCHLTDYSDGGDPRLIFAVPTNRLPAWRDLVGYELVSLSQGTTR